MIRAEIRDKIKAMKRPVLKRNVQHAFAAELQIMEGKLKKLADRLKSTRKD
jgi:hypothetical protein